MDLTDYNNLKEDVLFVSAHVQYDLIAFVVWLCRRCLVLGSWSRLVGYRWRFCGRGGFGIAGALVALVIVGALVAEGALVVLALCFVVCWRWAFWCWESLALVGSWRWELLALCLVSWVICVNWDHQCLHQCLLR